MKPIYVLVLLFGAFCTCRGGNITADTSWNYTNQSAWNYVPGWYCAGFRQSPININTNNLAINRELVDLKLWNFNKMFWGTLSNNGHSVRFDPNPNYCVALFQNHMGTYQFQQFHFHWGPNSTVGSEHTINGHANSGELHFVMKKTTGVATTGNAYAVLAVMLISDSSTRLEGTWLQLYDSIPVYQGSSYVVYEVRLSDFLPPSSLDYYHYEGSLTTPPCNEIVQWFVLKNAVSVPSTFLNKLRSFVRGADGQVLRMNHRFQQPINGRQVMIKPNC